MNKLFKRVVSTALAIATVASMAVSASAAVYVTEANENSVPHTSSNYYVIDDKMPVFTKSYLSKAQTVKINRYLSGTGPIIGIIEGVTNMRDALKCAENLTVFNNKGNELSFVVEYYSGKYILRCLPIASQISAEVEYTPGGHDYGIDRNKYHRFVITVDGLYPKAQVVNNISGMIINSRSYSTYDTYNETTKFVVYVPITSAQTEYFNDMVYQNYTMTKNFKYIFTVKDGDSKLNGYDYAKGTRYGLYTLTPSAEGYSTYHYNAGYPHGSKQITYSEWANNTYGLYKVDTRNKTYNQRTFPRLRPL